MNYPSAGASLDRWLQYLSDSHPPARIVLGLERVAQAAETLAVLPPAPRSIVVAGTNGKGSTAVFAEQLMLAAGLRVGCTLSPHLLRFNERIRVNGKETSDELICCALYEVESRCQAVDLTYFERVILAALWIFKQAELDVCVLEVGLGGRLDAVNIVDGDVSVITSIGLDHLNYLGQDLAAIAAEKAGVMRPGKPCVLGDANLPNSIDEWASHQQACLLKPGNGYDYQRGSGIAPMHWSFQTAHYSVTGLDMPRIALENAACGLAAVCALGMAPQRPSINQAVARTSLPGRFQKQDTASGTVILDVAHNAAGAAFLAKELNRTDVNRPECQKTIAVAGFLRDKDAASIVAALKNEIDHWMLVDVTAERGLLARQSAALAGQILEPGSYECENLENVISRVIAGNYRGFRIVIFGCFRLIELSLKLLHATAQKSSL